MFAEKLKNYRTSLHLTQEEFSKRCGISRAIISMLEAGTRPPSKNVLIKLSNFSNQTIEWWIGNEVEKMNEYKPLNALNVLLDYMVDKNMFGPNGEIPEKELKYILKILQAEIKIKKDQKKTQD
ncbi:helix-turn-helix transcriptional regulator [Clostridium botulinum C]|uniref:HTH cro/C1-type domain-containing protein n=1 Tax=Clostridium novyi B str. ATCC 27606 TaxID=1443123 RepID=A0AA40M4K8_CLONO|nr:MULTISPECIES: helix-turn-helix domain-containing protein [Clostridium]KEI08123.1 hypothetical protein Z958_p0003 [Clostridium novyi B str. NCTC 9691]KEI11464.1 hypothetical protein Z959_p0027 [Clostridium novyi B str. ATCC 27606]MCD3207121.1 helix-turn-helix transcriptional regulator [Clostridium botulinum C]MCD3209700.1 helix-turn-helix transcriptional regulator [Clostridium botulinum C]MCD3226613.1 helix-turn-helix transcriptional regulator [Clostridium botulinum C]